MDTVENKLPVARGRRVSWAIPMRPVRLGEVPVQARPASLPASLPAAGREA